MAPHTTSHKMLGLALLCLCTTAGAANPLGLAVAGAPSMFVLAVAESRGDTRDARAESKEHERREEACEPATARPRRAEVQAAQHRAADDAPAENPRFTLR